MLQQIIITFLFACCASYAKDFGTKGHVFPIEEESLKQYFKRQAADEKYLDRFKTHAFEMALTPQPIIGLNPAVNNRFFTLDLTYKVENAITDKKGQTIVKAGTMINPLDRVQLSSGLLFLDGTNKSHLTWARKQIGNFKWILVSGKPIELEEKEGRFIYFDQWGKYSSRFQIQHIPAKVVQKGNLLLVEEIALTKEGI